MNNKITEIINSFINAGVQNIKEYASQDLWDSNPEKAMMLAIERSNTFDEKFYLLKNLDIIKNRVDPIEHFIKFGYEEKRKYKILSERTKEIKLFSIVTACYNVEKYLDDYFSSLICQTLNFEDNIICIMIDDGSTDNTAIKIKHWLNKYPNNIIYIYKKNGGQASARNLGLKYVNSKWVTFIDADDFVNEKYFEEVLIALDYKPYMLCTNLINYYEINKTFKNNEPLNYKFQSKYNIVKIKNIKWEIQQSTASAFFLTSEIKKRKISFKEECKPNFEDSLFIIDYIEDNFEKDIIFIKNSEYYYRKRKDKSSTVNLAYTSKLMYKQLFEKGYLPVLNRENISEYAKKVIFYNISWQIDYLLDYKNKLDFLSENEKNTYLTLLKKVFSYLDENLIFSLNRIGFNYFKKIGVLKLFKNQKCSRKPICYIEKFDIKNNAIKIKYYSQKYASCFLLQNKTLLNNNISKTFNHYFLDRLFAIEKFAWINLRDELYSKIEFILDCKKGCFSLNGRFFNELKLKDLYNYFSDYCKLKKQEIWVFLDRESQADDNAEHLYRWMKKNHPEIQIYFILMKSSHDWNRLKKENFNLIDYNSNEFNEIINKCDKLISSSIGDTVHKFYNSKIKNKKFIFLQHGVTKDNISQWLNTENIDLIITVSQDEYNSFISDEYGYKFTEKEVVLTGFPRFDSLITNNNAENIILFTPTWRKDIVGEIDVADKRKINKNFSKTKYFKEISHFLNYRHLNGILSKYNYKLVFFLHPNTQDYANLFKSSSRINITTYHNSSIQEYLKKSKIMITDYSSLAFDMAYMNKPVIYYQFDREEFFSGVHSYTYGYYNYEQDGFGPIVISLSSLIYVLSQYLDKNCSVEKRYIENTKNFFSFSDNNNCSRTFSEIARI